MISGKDGIFSRTLRRVISKNIFITSLYFVLYELGGTLFYHANWYRYRIKDEDFMTTIVTHGLVGMLFLNVIGDTKNIYLKEYCYLAFITSLITILPDLDVLSFGLGIPYSHMLGHRGISHSLLFAISSTGLFLFILTRLSDYFKSKRVYFRVALILFIAALSHPLLDMMTDGGLGCAFFAPFKSERYFLPWRPIPVSPIGIKNNLLGVLKWELTHIGLFCGLGISWGVGCLIMTIRQRK